MRVYVGGSRCEGKLTRMVVVMLMLMMAPLLPPPLQLLIEMAVVSCSGAIVADIVTDISYRL